MKSYEIGYKQVSALINNQLHQAEIEDIVCANVLFDNGALCSIQSTINQPKGHSIRQIAGDKAIIVIPEVKSLTSDQNDHILLGTYEKPLSTEVTTLIGHHDQPQTTWKTLQLPNQHSLLKRLVYKVPGHKWILKSLTLPKTFLPSVLKKKKSAMSVLMDNFIDAILNDKEPIVNGENTLPTIELINAIVLSALRKKTVDLPLDRKEYDQLFDELSCGTTQVSRFR